MKRFTRDDLFTYILRVSTLITEAKVDNSYYKTALQDFCRAYAAHDDEDGMPVIDAETNAKLAGHISRFGEDEIFLKNNPVPLEAMAAPLLPAEADHSEAAPHAVGNVGFVPVPAYAAVEPPHLVDREVGEGEIRAMPAQAPIEWVIDSVRQKVFNEMVAKIKQIDIEIGKGRAVRKKDYLKGCFNEVLQEVKSHEAGLLNHSLDVPTCIRKSVFMQQCTYLNADANTDAWIATLLGLTEASFDAFIH